MDLPKKESTFDFEYQGITTGREYKGQFTVKCVLNMAMKHQLELEKTRLMADYNNPSDGLAGLAVILSKLRIHIIDAPEWWQQSRGGMAIEDEDLLVALYDRILEAEEKWREKVRSKGTKAQEQNQKDEAEKTPVIEEE